MESLTVDPHSPQMPIEHSGMVLGAGGATGNGTDATPALTVGMWFQVISGCKKES